MNEYYKTEKLYIECECSSEILQITENFEKYNNCKRYFYLTIFSSNFSKFNIFKRIKFAIKFIFIGKINNDFYSNQMLISCENMQKIKNFITERDKMFQVWLNKNSSIKNHISD
jgi:translation initiation factor IF-1